MFVDAVRSDAVLFFLDLAWLHQFTSTSPAKGSRRRILKDMTLK